MPSSSLLLFSVMPRSGHSRIKPGVRPGCPGSSKHRCAVVIRFLLRAPSALSVEEMLRAAGPRQPRRVALRKSNAAGDAHHKRLAADAAGEQRVGAEILDGVDARIDARVVRQRDVLRAYAQR